MAAKPKGKMDAEAAAKAVEDALDVELTFDDLNEPSLEAMSDDEVFNELEKKLSAAAADLKESDLSPAKKVTSKTDSSKAANIENVTAPQPTAINSEFEAMRAKEPEAANDDRRDAVAQLVYGLQKKASSASLILAAILSACWIGIIWYYVKTTDPQLLDISNGITSKFSIPKTYLYLGIALIPVLLLWAFAILIRRAQEMRHAAQSMTEAAIQLMQPENIATDSVSTVGHAIRREVAAMGDGVERALARAGELETLVQSEVLNLQRSYSDSEIRLRTLLVDLGNERENVVGHAEKLRTSIADSHVGLTDELTAASGRIQGVIDEATSQLSNTLVQREQGIQATLSEAGDNLVSLLSSSGAEIESRITTGTQKIEDQLSTRTQDLTQQINMAGSAFANLLDTQSARLQDQSEASTRQFEDAIGLRISEFSSRLNETGSELQTQLDSRLEKLDSSLVTKGEAFVQALGNRTEALDKVLSDRTAHISDTLKERLTSFGQSMTSHLDTVNENLTNRQISLEKTTEAIGNSITKRAELLEDGLKMHHADIAASLQNGLAAVSSKAEEIRNGLDTQHSALVEGMDDKSRSLLADLDTRLKSLTAGVEENATNLKSLMEEKAAVMAETLSSGSETLFTGLDTQTSNLRTGLEKRSSDLLNNLATQSTSFAENLEARVGAVQSSVEENAASLLSGLDQRNASIDKLIAARSQSLNENLESHTGNIDKVIAAKTEALNESLSQHSAGIENVLSAKAGTFDETLSKHASVINDTIAQRAGELDQSLGAFSSKIDQSISARTGALKDALDQRSHNFAAGLEERVGKIAETVASNSNSLISSLDVKAGELGTIMADGETTFVAAVENKYGLFSKMLADKQQAISLDLDQKIENTAGIIDEKAAAISNILTERAAVINSTLGEGLTGSQRMLETKTREFNDLLANRSSELSKILDESALPLVDQIKSQGDLVASNLGSVHQSLNDEVGGLLERLGTVSLSMAELIAKAGGDLSSMEQTITEQAANMSEAVLKARLDVDQSSQLAENAHQKMDETAQNLLANIGGIAQRFEQQGKMLEQATGMIDAAQNNFSATIEDREGALSNLAAGLSTRAEEIERSMASFSEMLTRTMDEMTQRSRQVGSTVSQEIGTAIEETTARYAAATEAMRQASMDVQRELEETRAQMRRGVMELPDETKQSADAMRKVVADQIAALRDLSEIVAKSGKSLDTAAALPQQNMATAAQARPLSAPMQSTVSPQPAASRSQSPSNLGSILSPRSPQSPTMKTAPQSTPQNPAGGWVSDLLKRASENEQPAKPRSAQNELHKIESLNALSMDIARLMDDEASVDLWKRYQRGERNVFTRRLYTLQGQHTFDEIRNKYSREPEFRRAVDRYVDDFERLLGDVVQNDRDNIMTQTYLTSDTGKVYTMLAHASGRLGS